MPFDLYIAATLGVLLAACLTMGLLAELVHIPKVTAYVLVGLVTGPSMLGMVELIAKHKDEPFWLGIGFVRPHVPFVAPRSYYPPFNPYSKQQNDPTGKIRGRQDARCTLLQWISGEAICSGCPRHALANPNRRPRREKKR